jgi:hypothetical protein
MADPEQELVEQSVRDTEDELLKSAFAPAEEAKAEPKEAPPEAPQTPVETPQQGTERARDPQTGRFAAKGPAAPAPAESAEAPAKADDEILPSWRAREINEERRQAQVELERMRVEHARMQAHMAQLQRAQAPAQAPQAPDPVIDPAAYTKYVQDTLRQEFQQQAFNDRLNMNLEMTHMRHGEKFEKAYEAVLTAAQRGDQAIVRHFTSQPNPGEAMVRWYTNNEVLREVGPDPSAYKQKTRDELLKDPEFLAQAVEAHRRLATGGGQPQNTVVRLPPSLSKATGSSEQGSQTHTDGSEAQLFAYAMQPKRR